MKNLLQRTLVLDYLETNNIPHRVGAIHAVGFPYGGIIYLNRGIIKMVAPRITEQQMYDMEVSVKASQTADFSPGTKDFNNLANVDTIAVATLERNKKIFKGLIFTDPATGLEVDLQEYSGEDANAVVDNQPPLPPTIVAVTTATATSLALQFSGASDSDGSIKGYIVYVDGVPTQETLSFTTLLTGLESGTEYVISVYSVDNDDTQGIFATTIVTSTSLTNLPPSAPTLVVSSSHTSTQITLTISGGSDSDGTVVGYEISASGLASITTTGSANINEITLTGLIPSTTYLMDVKTIDNDGERSSAYVHYVNMPA